MTDPTADPSFRFEAASQAYRRALDELDKVTGELLSAARLARRLQRRLRDAD